MSDYAESVRLGFAVHCDEHDLTADEALDLAERISDELIQTASFRQELRDDA